MIRSGGSFSRLICYVEDNLKCNILEDLNMEEDTWLRLKIRSGKRLWNDDNFYREHRKIRVARCEMEAKQLLRLKDFLTIMRRSVKLGNNVRTGKSALLVHTEIGNEI